jgi:GTP-binding protein
MPQTKFVLKKAIALGLIPVVVINKIDKEGAEPDRVMDEVFDLLVALDANEEQLEFPVLYAAARDGYAKWNLEDDNVDMTPLFEAILKHVPYPDGSADAPTQAQVFTLDSDNFVGRIGIARIFNGKLKKGDE